MFSSCGFEMDWLNHGAKVRLRSSKFFSCTRNQPDDVDIFNMGNLFLGDEMSELKIHTATGGYLFKTINKKTRYIHIEIAEKALGKKLPKGAEVHHVNSDPTDNRNENLVICQDHKYHSLLHMRTEALEVTGNANMRLCKICGIYSDPSWMRKTKTGQMYHVKCNAFESKKRRAKLKSK